jgi:hypothetical protein
MVSHSMQGGCLCENAPGLRVDYSNMEIAAVPAPRPQILVAATGDWTKRTMTVEGPAIESVYRLFKATNRLRYVIFDYDHNYNKTTREAVYDWFGRWLLHENDAAKLKEQPYKKEPDADLRVFPENKPPEGALNDQQLIAAIIARSQEQLAPLQRSDAASLAKWKETMRPAWEHALQIHPPVRRTSIKSDPGESIEGGVRLRQFTLPRAYADGFLNCSGALPENASASCVAVLVQPEGRAGINSNPIAAELLKKGVPVIAADLFLTGDAADDAAASTRKHHANFFTTYNRTDLQERISDLKVLVAHVRQQFPGKKVVLVGEQAGGLWAILAAPLADAVIADAHQFDATPENLIHPNIFFPGFYSIGGFAGALRAAAPNPVLVHNLHASSDLPRLEQLYSAVSEKAHFTTAREKKDATSLAAWITVAVRN